MRRAGIQYETSRRRVGKALTVSAATVYVYPTLEPTPMARDPSDRFPVLAAFAEVPMRATRPLLPLYILTFLCASLMLPSGARTQEGGKPVRHYALVVGNDAYKHVPPLKTAVNDARAVEAVLREQYGFQTRLLLNATRQQIINALNSYRRELDAESSLLVYYAGHGVNDKEIEKAYWLPVDAERDDNANWISADDITSNIKGIPARHVLIVSDSCYSGTLTRGLEVASSVPAVRERYLQKMAAGRSRTLMASGGDEPVADAGGAGNHSVFAGALLRGLQETEKPRFTAAELYREFVEEAVAGRATQTPEYNPLRNSGHESGDFVFVRVKTPDGKTVEVTVKTVPSGPVDPAAVELSFWETIKGSSDPEDFKAYLQQYPSGRFAALAKNRVNSLGASAKPAPTPAVEGIDGVAKSFRGSLGIWAKIFSGGSSALSGDLVVSSGKVVFRMDARPGALESSDAKYIVGVLEPTPEGLATLPCSRFEKARLEGNFIREIPCSADKCRFYAESAAAAASALDYIQKACNPSTQPTSAAQAGADSLEGTTWRGTSPGGDKRYEFQFLPNGEVTLDMKWNNAGTYKGTWRRTGDVIKMDFRPGWTDPFETTLNGDKMTGSWAKGQYKFTVVKVP